ncbi:hypothetical protein EWM64_g8113 [Hericium alpestre]|uniref:Uncharacterized protein n=1 Tax=Hericium alpestre TaxID=135208 RepID=A0A4Y9ZQZ9_9AGAM|nr:hypothetical protein EWM64_g8113 [Hericium alpestre]
MVWSILCCMFDRFKCLRCVAILFVVSGSVERARRWNNGPTSGAFKRIMTYSYLLSVPLIIVYSLGFAIIKYGEYYVTLPGIGIIPTPHQLWTNPHQDAILPLYLCLSVAWSLEMVTHLEELCFWLFVVNAGAVQRDWFGSLYFKTWAVGSVAAIIYMPLVTIFTRADPLKCEAYTMLAGGLGSMSLTVWFIPILYTFPTFLRNMRREGVDMATIVRLTKFHEINTIRVAFRFLFAAPLLILAIDGIRPHQHINDNMAGTDLLTMLSGLGVTVSSALTLVIFFPRSIEGEIYARDRSQAPAQQLQTLQSDDAYTTYNIEGGEQACPGAQGGEGQKLGKGRWDSVCRRRAPAEKRAASRRRGTYAHTALGYYRAG